MAKFTLKSRIKDVLEDIRAREIIESYLPDILKNPNIKYAITLNPTIKTALKYRKKVDIDTDIINNMLNEILSLD